VRSRLRPREARPEVVRSPHVADTRHEQVPWSLLIGRSKSIRVRVRFTNDVPNFCDEEVIATFQAMQQ
jgi:hypothetical protein